MGGDWARLVNWVRRAQIRRAARYPFHGLPTKKHHHHISPRERCSKQFAAKHGKKTTEKPRPNGKAKEGEAPFATLAQNITHLLVPYARPRQPTTQNPPSCVLFFGPFAPAAASPRRKWRANTLSIIRAKCGRSNPADFLLQNIRRSHSPHKK